MLSFSPGWLVILLISGSLGLLPGCNKDKSSDGDDDVSNTGSLQLDSKGGQVISELNASLTKDDFVTEEEASVITTAAAGSLAIDSGAGLRFTEDEKIDPDDIKAAAPSIVKDGVAALAIPEAGLGDPEKTIMNSSVKALPGAGISSVDAIEKSLKSSVVGTLDGFAQTKVGTDGYAYLMDDLMKGAVSGFTNLGFGGETAAADFQTISTGISAHAIAYMDDIGITDPEILKDASGSMAAGMMNAYGEFPRDLISEDALRSATESISQASVDALYSFKDTITGDFSTFASGFTNGMLEGLAKGGLKQSELKTFNNSITGGFYDAISDEGGKHQWLHQ